MVALIDSIIRSRWLYLYLVIIVLIALLWRISLLEELSQFNQEGFIVQDFLYHSILTQALMRGDILTPWDFEAQQVAINLYSGHRYNILMPIGFSPVGIGLIAVFLLIAQNQHYVAYVLWISISLGACLLAGRVYIREPSSKLTAVLCLVLLSQASFAAIELGQTTHLALGTLIFFASKIFEKPSGWGFVGSSFTALLLLSIKPLYFVVGFFMMIASGRPRDIFYVCLGLLLSSVLVTLWMGTNFSVSYIQGLRLYTQELPSRYSLGFGVQEYTTIRGVLSATLGDSAALCVSRALSYSFLLFGLFLSIISNIRRWGLGLVVCVALAIGLVLSPYAGRYENCLLCLPIMLIMREVANRSKIMDLVILILAVLTWCPPLFNDRAGSILCLKTLLLLALISINFANIMRKGRKA